MKRTFLGNDLRFVAQKLNKQGQQHINSTWLQRALVVEKWFSLEVCDFSLNFQLFALQAGLNIFNFFQ